MLIKYKPLNFREKFFTNVIEKIQTQLCKLIRLSS